MLEVIPSPFWRQNTVSDPRVAVCLMISAHTSVARHPPRRMPALAQVTMVISALHLACQNFQDSSSGSSAKVVQRELSSV